MNVFYYVFAGFGIILLEYPAYAQFNDDKAFFLVRILIAWVVNFVTYIMAQLITLLDV